MPYQNLIQLVKNQFLSITRIKFNYSFTRLPAYHTNKHTSINIFMKTHNSRGLVLLICILMNINLSAKDSLSSKRPPEITMKEAIDKGILDYRICGLFDPRNFDEVVDQDGVHFGKCMVIILQSKIDSVILLRLDAGTELIPDDSSVQTMIVTHEAILALYPNQTYATRLYAMCGQLHEKAPTAMHNFKVGELADSNIVKIATYLNDNYIQNMIGQHALWACTDRATFEELKKYGADSSSIAMTKNILTNLKIETELTPKVPEPPKVIVEETNEILINQYYVYGGLGLILILTTSLIVIILKGKKKTDTIA